MAQFNCEVNKIQMMKTNESLPIVWSKDEAEIITDKKKYEALNLNKKLILKIKDSKIEDSGTYRVNIGSKKSEATLTVKEIPVVIKKHLQDQKVKEGEIATFDCILNRSDRQPIWYINNIKLSEQDFKSNKYAFKHDKNRLQFEINNVELLKDNGCEVLVIIGDKAESRAKLQVIEDDIFFIEKLHDINTKEKDSCEFLCKLNKTKYLTRNNDELKVKWFIDNKEIKETDKKYHFEQFDTTLRLVIKSASLQDSSQIKCQISNSVYSIAQLTVEEETVFFVKNIEDINLNHYPKKIEFSCELNKENVKLNWFKGQERLNQNSKYSIESNGKQHMLSIIDIDIFDEGDYKACLANKVDIYSKANLTITSAPKIFLDAKYNEILNIKRSSPLIIDFKFSANPQPKVTWKFNNDTFKETFRTNLQVYTNKNIMLTVNKTQRVDSGIYSIFLENEYGKEECNITVNVYDRPSAPLSPNVFDISGKFLYKFIMK
jgi:hypothetical protein